MKLTFGKIRLTDLAHALEITPPALRQHVYKNNGGIAKDLSKVDETQTSDILLSIDSVSNFLIWLKARGRRVKLEKIEQLENELTSTREN